MSTFVLCPGEIVFVAPHFVGFVAHGQPLDRPLAVPTSVIDPRFPQPGTGPGSASSDYGLAIEAAWARRHLDRRSDGLCRVPAVGTLGALAAVALTWWVLS